MQFLVADFETFYGTGYTLQGKGTTYQNYILDDRFKVHGCGLKIIHGPKITPAKWVTARLLPQVFQRIDWANTALVGHNLPFDATILKWHYGIEPAMYVDTLALARAQIGACSARHSLDHLGTLLFGMGKLEGLSATRGVRDLSPELERQLGTYCERDCDLTHRVLTRLLRGMTKKELKAMDWTIRTFVNPKFILNTEVLSEHLAQLDANKAAALESVGCSTREMLNSSEQFASALRQLGIDPPMKQSKRPNKDGSDKWIYAFAKTDDGLKELLDHENTDVQTLVAARLEIKSLNEEVKTNAYLNSASFGAWPVSIKYAGAMNTQRFSGDSGGGGNPQNLGRTSPIRKAIEAPPGYKIVAADLSQIECRLTLQLAAYYYLLNRTTDMPATCREMEALETLRKGEDIYCWFGSMIYGRQITKKNDPLERQVSKAAVLGLGFGMGWKRFWQQCRENNVPMTEILAKRIVKLYRATFPNVVKAWNGSLRQLINLQSGLCVPEFQRILDPRKPRQGSNLQPLLIPERDPIFKEIAVRMPNGQYLKYPQLQNKTSGRKTEWWYINRGKVNYVHPGKVFENYVQALAGLIMRDQLVDIEDAINARGNEGEGVELSVHDELVTLIIDDDASLVWARHLLDGTMAKAPEYMPELPVAIELKEGYNYAECH
jgi:DNA polymerase III epsilon subunit-like protein